MFLIHVQVYATVLPFNNIASSFLSHKYYPDYVGNEIKPDGRCVPYSDDRHDDLKDDATHFGNIWYTVMLSANLTSLLQDDGAIQYLGSSFPVSWRVCGSFWFESISDAGMRLFLCSTGLTHSSCHRSLLCLLQ